jgi:argininosuccinate lyase
MADHKKKLWQKQTDTDERIEAFTVGQDRVHDLALAEFDVLGSMAHAAMLVKVGLLKESERQKLHAELAALLREIREGRFVIEDGVEDVHSQVELLLTRKLGDIGKKIHAGRSRNDQVLLDLKLYMRHRTRAVVVEMESLFNELTALSQQYSDVLMPGYTHMQVAMPSSFGLWFGAYAEALADDLNILKSAFELVNRNPLGSAAGYGSSFPLDREMTTDLLGFESMNYNVIYAQMGRGKAEKVLANAFAVVADTLGKLAMDVCLYMGQDYGFITFPDELTTGSSIMPHKKNPDVFEIIRARCNKLRALPNEIGMITTNLPTGYHRDLQIIKESFMPAVESIADCLKMTAFMLKAVQVNEHLIDQRKYDYLFSVEEVNRLVLQGVPFRDAYRAVGKRIGEGSFVPDKKVHHTHAGSLGNLCTQQISDRFEISRVWFAECFAHIDSKLQALERADH